MMYTCVDENICKVGSYECNTDLKKWICVKTLRVPGTITNTYLPTEKKNEIQIFINFTF